MLIILLFHHLEHLDSLRDRHADQLNSWVGCRRSLAKDDILEMNLVRGEILERHLVKVRVHSSKPGSEPSGFMKSSEFLNQMSNNKLGFKSQKLTLYSAGLDAYLGGVIPLCGKIIYLL